MRCPRDFFHITSGKNQKINNFFAPGDKNHAKIGSIFPPPPLTENKHTAPKRGPLCGPQNGNKGGATVVIFSQSQNGPSVTWRRSRPEAILYITGRPGNARGPLEGSTYTRKPVYAGGLSVTRREARRSGRPGDKYTVKSMEAGPGRRPYCIQLGSRTMREAH